MHRLDFNLLLNVNIIMGLFVMDLMVGIEPEVRICVKVFDGVFMCICTRCGL